MRLETLQIDSSGVNSVGDAKKNFGYKFQKIPDLSEKKRQYKISRLLFKIDDWNLIER